MSWFTGITNKIVSWWTEPVPEDSKGYPFVEFSERMEIGWKGEYYDWTSVRELSSGNKEYQPPPYLPLDLSAAWTLRCGLVAGKVLGRAVHIGENVAWSLFGSEND